MDQRIYLKVDDVAATLGLSEWSVYKMCQAGEIPGVKRFGRAVRVHRETLEQWAREQAAKGETA